MRSYEIIATIVAMIVFTGCASTSVTGRSASAIPNKIVYLASDRPIDDYTIHSAITTELTNRGYRVIDCKDHPPTGPVDGLVLRYMDKWRWDLKMFMSDLNIRILDGRTSEIIATATYTTHGLHAYPDPKKTVIQLFEELDQKGVL